MRKKKVSKMITLETIYTALLSLKDTVGEMYEDMVTPQSLAEVKSELQKEIVTTKKESTHHILQNSEQLLFLTQRVVGVEKTQDEILNILRPMQKAQDRDSEAIVSHDHRLLRVERKLSLRD